MINIAISLLIGTVIFLIGFFTVIPWMYSTLLGLLSAAIAFFILSKIIAKKVNALFTDANTELQKNRIER